MKPARVFLVLGAISAGVAVGLGAFATHALDGVISADHLDVFETGARYQVYHAFGLMLVGLALPRGGRATELAGWLFVAGSIIFSGSLYILAVSGARWWGAMTPVGGVSLIAGWVTLAVALWNDKNERR